MAAPTDAKTPTVESERRRSLRRRVLKQVQVLSLDRKSASAIDCTLRNISGSGAQLSGPGASISRIPNQFYLVAPGQLRMVRCKVAWKTYGTAGISFLSDPGHLASELTPGTEANSTVSSDPAWERSDEAEVNVAEPEAHPTPHTAVIPISELAARLLNRRTEEIVADTGRHIRHLPIGLLSPGSTQVRGAFDLEELQGLAQSIRDNGLLQPLIVRRRVGREDYEIVAGERRWRAAQLAEIGKVPVLIRELSDAEALEIALVENVQRSDLAPLEEARGYAQLIERYGYSQQQLAGVVGKSRSHVANMLRLLNLPDEVKAHVESGRLTAGHARTLVGADAPAELADHIIARRLNVRQTERLAKQQPGSRAPNGKGRPRHDSELGALERKVSEALGLKVEIAGPRQSGGRLVVHVQTLEQLNEVCRRLARQD